MPLRERAYVRYVEGAERTEERRLEAQVALQAKVLRKFFEDFNIDADEVEFEVGGNMNSTYGWTDGLHFKARLYDGRIMVEWERRDRQEWLTGNYMHEVGRLVAEGRLYHERKAIERVIAPGICFNEHQVERITSDGSVSIRITCGGIEQLGELPLDMDTSNQTMSIWSEGIMVRHERDFLRRENERLRRELEAHTDVALYPGEAPDPEPDPTHNPDEIEQ